MEEKAMGMNQSFWRASAVRSGYPELSEDVEADVVVAGGGISGVLAAYSLAEKGRSVALIEALKMGSGTTGGTTGKLTAQHGLIYHDLLERHGEQTARQYFEANQEGRQLIESLVREHGIDCDFRKTDAYVISRSEDGIGKLKKEAEAYSRLGIPGRMTKSSPPGFESAAALVMEDQAEFHAMNFLHGILQELESMGVQLYEGTRYMEAEQNGDRLVVRTNQPYTVTCSQIVLATLFPVEDPESFYSNTMKPFTSHLTSFTGGDIEWGNGMYITEDSPTRTFRTSEAEDGRLVWIIGGETHPTGDGSSASGRYREIRTFAKEAFGLTDMQTYWSEHDLVTPDKRPYIGPLEKGGSSIYVMTGYGKWGLAASACAARVIAGLITGEDHPCKELFDPHRQLPEDTGNQNGGNDKDEGKKNESTTVSRIAAELEDGQAIRMERDGKPVGIYKDEDGSTHILDLSCTHLGCEVAWNDGDRTWDCPCHGSVFDSTGNVLAGPAKTPLKKLER